MNRTEAAKLAREAKALKEGSIELRFWSKVSIGDPDECWPWAASFRRKDQRYGAFWMDGRHHPANRVAWELKNGPMAAGMFACHRCDNPSCCNPAHIFAGTNQDNNDDKVFKGRHARGIATNHAKLTADHVADIRSHLAPGAKRLANGIPQMLSEKYGITRQYVSEIMGQKSWRPE